MIIYTIFLRLNYYLRLDNYLRLNYYCLRLNYYCWRRWMIIILIYYSSASLDDFTYITVIDVSKIFRKNGCPVVEMIWTLNDEIFTHHVLNTGAVNTAQDNITWHKNREGTETPYQNYTNKHRNSKRTEIVNQNNTNKTIKTLLCANKYELSNAHCARIEREGISSYYNKSNKHNYQANKKSNNKQKNITIILSEEISTHIKSTYLIKKEHKGIIYKYLESNLLRLYNRLVGQNYTIYSEGSILVIKYSCSHNVEILTDSGLEEIIRIGSLTITPIASLFYGDINHSYTCYPPNMIRLQNSWTYIKAYTVRPKRIIQRRHYGTNDIKTVRLKNSQSIKNDSVINYGTAHLEETKDNEQQKHYLAQATKKFDPKKFESFLKPREPHLTQERGTLPKPYSNSIIEDTKFKWLLLTIIITVITHNWKRYNQCSQHHGNIRIIQANCHKSSEGNCTLLEEATSFHADIILASEVHTGRNGKITGLGHHVKCSSRPTQTATGQIITSAAIVCRNKSMPFICITGEGDNSPLDYTAAIIEANRQYLIVSVYVKPKKNEIIIDTDGTETTYLTKLYNDLTKLIREHDNKGIIIGGDFNTRHPSWDSFVKRVDTTRSNILINFAENNGLFNLNAINYREGLATYRSTTDHRDPNTTSTALGYSHIDLTFVDKNTLIKLNQWHIDPGSTISDHAPILMEIEDNKPRYKSLRKTFGKLNEKDIMGINNLIDDNYLSQNIPLEHKDEHEIDEAVATLTNYIHTTVEKFQIMSNIRPITQCSQRSKTRTTSNGNEIMIQGSIQRSNNSRAQRYQFKCITNKPSTAYQITGLTQELWELENDREIRQPVNIYITLEIITSKKGYSRWKRKAREILSGKLHHKKEKNAAPWWNAKLTRLRSIYKEAARAYYSTEHSDDPEVKTNMTTARKLYTKEIKTARKESWMEYVSISSSIGAWESAYKTIMNKRKFKNCMQAITTPDGKKLTDYKQVLDALMSSSFPMDDISTDTTQQKEVREQMASDHYSQFDDITITQSEVETLINTLPYKKAPGIDGISGELLRGIAGKTSKYISAIIQSCLLHGYFPKQWKVAYVVMIPKPGKDPSSVKGWRPICLLCNMAKLLDKIVINNIMSQYRQTTGICQEQFGFEAHKSTIHAINEIVTTINTKRKEGVVAIICLDVSGAFDNAWHPEIIRQLKKAAISHNLMSLIKSYLRDREAVLEYNGITSIKEPNRGCPQGSSSGPMLWNIVYNDLLMIANENTDTRIIAYADDATLIVWARTQELLQSKIKRALKRVLDWGASVKLSFGPEKTELLYFDQIRHRCIDAINNQYSNSDNTDDLHQHKRRKLNLKNKSKTNPFSINVDGHIITESKLVRILGFYINNTLTWRDHIEIAIKKANAKWQLLSPACSNKWGLDPRNAIRIFEGAIQPVLTYGSPIWHNEIKTSTWSKKLIKWQQEKLVRLCRAFSKISSSIANIVSGVIPMNLLIEEQAINWHITNIHGYTYSHKGETISNLSLIRKCRIKVGLPEVTKTEEIPAPEYYIRRVNNKRSRKGYDLTKTQIRSNVEHHYIKSRENTTHLNAYHLNLFTGETIKAYRYRKTPSWRGTNTTVQLLATEYIIEEARRRRLLHNDKTFHFIYFENETEVNYNELISNDLNNSDSANILRLIWANNQYIKLHETQEIWPEVDDSIHDIDGDKVKDYKAKVKKWMYDVWNDKYTRECADPKSWGKHTRKIFPNVIDRTQMKWVIPGYRMTQILTDHGYFNNMLSKQEIVKYPYCEPCASLNIRAIDNAEHYVFNCQAYANDRQILEEYTALKGYTTLKEIMSDRSAYYRLKKFIHKNKKLDWIENSRISLISISGQDE